MSQPKEHNTVWLHNEKGEVIIVDEQVAFSSLAVEYHVVCEKCGGKEFNVGAGQYFAALRCVKCEYEICIHDG